jgi:hypothetical protein
MFCLVIFCSRKKLWRESEKNNEATKEARSEKNNMIKKIADNWIVICFIKNDLMSQNSTYVFLTLIKTLSSYLNEEIHSIC